MKKILLFLLVMILGMTSSAFASEIDSGLEVDPDNADVEILAGEGACLSDKTGLTEFNGLTNTDLLARLIYAEASGESLEGKRGVAHVVKNRISKNSNEFGGNTYAGVILKPGEFAGMTTSYARCPSTSTTAWKDSLSVANNTGTNPIGKTLWFNRNDTYTARTWQFPGYEGYSFNGGSSYKKVVEKVVIGNHTFFRVDGY